MNAREQAARENNDIKLFLSPDEVALLLSCLAWVTADLQVADEELRKLGGVIGEPIKSSIPPEASDAFAALPPVLTLTYKTLLVHSAAHFDETEDNKGRADFQDKMNKFHESTLNIKYIRTLVSLGTSTQSYYETMSKQDKGSGT
jgi:hypothetical protein